MFDVVEDADEHLVLPHSERRTLSIFVRAVVDDSVHVKLHLCQHLTRGQV